MSPREKVNLFLIGYGIGLVITSALDLADELHATHDALEGQRRRADEHNAARHRMFEELRAERSQSAQLAATVRELRREEAGR